MRSAVRLVQPDRMPVSSFGALVARLCEAWNRRRRTLASSAVALVCLLMCPVGATLAQEAALQEQSEAFTTDTPTARTSPWRTERAYLGYLSVVAVCFVLHLSGRTRKAGTARRLVAANEGLRDDATERPVTERPVAERPVAERRVRERRVTTRRATERRATEQAPTEQPRARSRTVQTVQKELAGIRVLVAEDDLAIQLVVGGMVARLGGAVEVAGNGLEAVSAVDTKRYDLVLMDVQMPVLDGFQATAQIRERESQLGSGRPLPVIGMTGNAMARDRKNCLVAGMDGYISKPFTLNQLKEVLLQWWARPDTQSEAESGPLTIDSETPPVDISSTQERAAAEPLTRPAVRVDGTRPTQKDAEETSWRRIEVALGGPDVGGLDPNLLRGFLVREFGGSSELLATFVQSFVETTPHHCISLRESFNSGDDEGLRRAVHSLKGASAMLGANKLSHLCRQMETFEDEDLLREDTLAAIEVEAERVRCLLSALPAALGCDSPNALLENS